MDSNASLVNNQSAFEALDLCCQKIIEKMGDKPIEDWRLSDYNALSSKLGSQTKVYLSINTLKRLFGQLKTPQRYFPQKATRDALAQFIGYRDWHEFELVNAVGKGTVTETVTIPEPQLPLKKKKANGRVMALILSLIVVSVAISIYFLFWKNNGLDAQRAELVCENPFGSVPHTAVFKLKSTGDSDRQYHIDFMDEATTAEISGRKEVAKFFRNPGVVYATLLAGNKPIDTVAVYMQTKGWVANSGNDTSTAFPIAGLKPLNPKNISVSKKQLDSAGLATNKPFLVGYSNIKPSGISGDNFSFKCRVFAEQSRPGTQCVETTIIILGEKHRHLLTLNRQNCVAFSEYKFSEKRVIGSEQFLGALAFDPVNGGDIEIRVVNKHVSLILNQKKVLEVSYNKTIGKVMGIKILFSGIGKAVSPILQDLSTREIF
ncbi:hypothetical protein OC25_07730 [Pedobacter kyungheensis]|uniref:Uncharacterized protein n=1 Tax=Pedobacter kyungheensis TaxID=1069985 RepID=A0A0C1FQI8_9SPHI|nr:hypothetical protein [Pedobacter kyungheensis]KIA95197.1 hypothetical protein OC25_07730 [Pedobacter kyungheensis]